MTIQLSEGKFMESITWYQRILPKNITKEYYKHISFLYRRRNSKKAEEIRMILRTDQKAGLETLISTLDLE